ncbi:hypothetical protein [Micromonospora echinofusca]|uniref:Uncharacterized protein n=1 Tax=Micromonospora echinofusca TaxID=47858 RepID=A0ABS3VX37_MICEH|nr:hypothetical protein [Micromonospora echinofusca]MBO4208939.1 hypothetical protein [Micromonospora echinofusca]
MRTDRVVAAVQRHVLDGAAVEERYPRPDGVVLYAGRTRHEVVAADWLVTQAAWVDGAVRVVAGSGAENYTFSYGLIFPVTGDALFLNDVSTMRELGGRVGTDLAPVAYAELLAELYSDGDVSGPRVLASSATELHRSGELVREPAATAGAYPALDPALLAAPTVEVTDGRTVLRFDSCHYLITEAGGALDVLRWEVRAGGGEPADWSRRYLARRQPAFVD